MTNKRIYSKKYHSLRVMEISNKLAQELNLSEEEIEVATLIGLLHDIARFEQCSRFPGFKDTKIFDHGDVGVEILEKDNFIRKFIKNDKYDDIIKVAIKNHNKFEIEEGLTDIQNKFCKLIRDADKIDIFFQGVNNIWNQEEGQMEESKLNSKVKKEFDDKKSILSKNNEKIEYADKLLQFLSFVFDLNYKPSFKILNKEKYIEKMLGRFEFKDEYTRKEMLKAKEETIQYILKKIQE